MLLAPPHCHHCAASEPTSWRFFFYLLASGAVPEQVFSYKEGAGNSLTHVCHFMIEESRPFLTGRPNSNCFCVYLTEKMSWQRRVPGRLVSLPTASQQKQLELEEKQNPQGDIFLSESYFTYYFSRTSFSMYIFLVFITIFFLF